jgi:hypothetical protein
MRAAMIKAFGEPAEVMTQCPVARSQFVGRQYRKARIVWRRMALAVERRDVGQLLPVTVDTTKQPEVSQAP